MALRSSSTAPATARAASSSPMAMWPMSSKAWRAPPTWRIAQSRPAPRWPWRRGSAPPARRSISPPSSKRATSSRPSITKTRRTSRSPAPALPTSARPKGATRCTAKRGRGAPDRFHAHVPGRAGRWQARRWRRRPAARMVLQGRWQPACRPRRTAGHAGFRAGWRRGAGTGRDLPDRPRRHAVPPRLRAGQRVFRPCDRAAQLPLACPFQAAPRGAWPRIADRRRADGHSRHQPHPARW